MEVELHSYQFIGCPWRNSNHGMHFKRVRVGNPVHRQAVRVASTFRLKWTRLKIDENVWFIVRSVPNESLRIPLFATVRVASIRS